MCISIALVRIHTTLVCIRTTLVCIHTTLVCIHTYIYVGIYAFMHIYMHLCILTTFTLLSCVDSYASTIVFFGIFDYKFPTIPYLCHQNYIFPCHSPIWMKNCSNRWKIYAYWWKWYRNVDEKYSLSPHEKILAANLTTTQKWGKKKLLNQISVGKWGMPCAFLAFLLHSANL